MLKPPKVILLGTQIERETTRVNFGAMLAAELGLPYAFASHFAPELIIRRCRSTATASNLRAA
jgi:hypothetical protein